MNKNGYASLDMSKRLVTAGVEMETGKYWLVQTEMLVEKSFRDFMIKEWPNDFLPAPSLAELWEWLSEFINELKEHYPYDIETYNICESGENTYCGYYGGYGLQVSNPNPADALGELALWMVENKKKERK